VNLAAHDRLANRAVMKNAPALAQFALLTVSQLSREIIGGNTAAFEEFYHRYVPRVYGLLMVLTHANDDLARELLQVVMLRAARKFKAAQDDNALWGWLATVARNVVIDHIRSEDRRRRREQTASLSSPTDPAGLPEELASALQHALTELEPEEQTLIRDFYYNTESQAAIAAKHETTVKAIQSRLARIRHRLKETLTRKLEHEI
jgi:RNA polymerase sigma-70 factor, ECF subfamily